MTFSAEKMSVANPLAGYTILVADDEVDIRRAVVALLSRTGAHTITAGDGVAAAQLALEDPGPDLVILDFSMPKANGLTAIEAIRKEKLDIPIILHTGQSFSHGMPLLDSRVRLLSKPNSILVLVDTVTRLLVSKDEIHG